MDVLTAAWVGAGSPAPTGLGLPDVGATEGRCARCGLDGLLLPTRSVISRAFTGFDRWMAPSGAGLCAVCAWGYSEDDLRSSAHLITRTPSSLQVLTRPQAGEILQRPLNADQALVVPLRPGRKHIVPDAAWGQVNLDDSQLRWGTEEAQLLQLVVALRQLGFGSRMLAEPAPAFTVLQALPRQRWRSVLTAWQQLSSWRVPDSPWLPLALHVTTPPAPVATNRMVPSNRTRSTLLNESFRPQ